MKAKDIKAVKTALAEPAEALLAESIYVLELSVRTANTLDKAGVVSVNDLLSCCGKKSPCAHCRYSPDVCGCMVRLLDVPNFGGKTLEEVYRCLERVGLVRSSHRKEAEKRAKKYADREEREQAHRRQFPRSYGRR